MKKLIGGLIALSLKNKFFVFFCVGVLVVAGIYCFKVTPIEAFPDVTNTEITIITQWPGKSAEEVERFVTMPVEIAMNTVQKKTVVRSSTLFGLSSVKLIFDDGVQDFFARQQVMNALQGLTLPDNINPQVMPPTGPTGEIFRFTLRSKTKTVRELKTLEDWVVERNILSVPGVADINSFGGEVKTYEVSVNPKKLADLDITPLQVYQALARTNLNVGGDIIEKNSQAYVVRGIGLLNNIPEIENTIVDNQNGIPILVKNVAEVAESHLPSLGRVGRDTADNVVEGIVLQRKGENPSEVVAHVQEKVKELNEKILPADVKMDTYYDRQTLIDYATHTVLHNMTEGIIFVTVIVFLFMADWRTTLIVSLIIPLSLLFAFICLRLKGMNANLLSMGAVDFGIIIDGCVVMVEGIFVALDELAHKVGMDKFNRMSKLGLIKRTTAESGKSIFFAKLIIITGLIPIFSFQKVEGKVFSPLAYTLGFALLGALLLTLTFVPVLSSILLNKNVREKHNPFVEWVVKGRLGMFDWAQRHKKISLLISGAALVLGLMAFRLLGTEFLPQLNEGALWVRATLPMSISLNESSSVADRMRRIFTQFPEVKQVVSQTGRPDDGTDATGFYNLEFMVDLYPKEQWERNISKDELIEEMQQKLSIYPGVVLNFSQPIMDNVEEAASGVKGSIAVKIFGDDINIISQKADEVYAQLKTVRGIDDLGVVQNLGQPELRVDLDENKMAVFGVATADAQTVIQMAVGGQAATQIYEGYRKFDLRVRYLPEYRKDESDIGKLMVPTLRGTKVQLKEIAKITTKTGPVLIFREGNKRYAAVKFSARGRDMGSTVAEAQRKVNAHVKLPPGYLYKWAGDFENQQRATDRLKIVVPITLIIIFMLLFILFGNLKDCGLVLLNVPFATIGGILLLLIRDINFSISAGIGFVALFGISVQNGVILITKFKHNMMLHDLTFPEAIRQGVQARIRPVIMTAMMGAIGLIPAALSTGIGSETSRPLATVVIAGLITDIIFDLFALPVIFYYAYRNHNKNRPVTA
ncbi:efflux RND transporter permease subunit [Chitinophaga flava]|uniref:CusA/CzcA family heavy metal efflux RND transporter n=1 Tax=Chitinophaga flava TaxID=2259036 RepID=A0A365XTV9_9BACT|nr:CusA/CzcA family heavy metal efflux RND transporter [Chitinophaga flava]RBL89558.1 CusA/CzcA family heavy metal efflux RND transporter [Chitinophaga flava]